MPVPWAQGLVAAFSIYAIVGVIFALVFVLAGVQRVDPAAQAGASWGFRVLILPGCTALWPLLAWRWVARRHPPTERNAHRTRAGADS